MQNYLVGNNIKLVKFTEKYLTSSYLNWLNDHSVNRYLCTGRLSISRDNINIPTDDKNLLYALLSKSSLLDNGDYTKYIGTISLHSIDYICRKGEIGYMIGEKSYWGRGVATEAIKLITDYAFNRLNLNKLTAGVVDGNTASAKSLEKNGFKVYGTLPQEYYLEGMYLSVSRYYKLQRWHINTMQKCITE